MESQTILIDVFSDISCPWCYVGYRKLLKAKEEYLKKYPDNGFMISYHPFIIDWKTNIKGEEYMAYNKRRWGGDEWTHSLFVEGKKYGCKYQNWKIWPNSFLSHCLLVYAQENTEKQLYVLLELFELTYERGENVSDIEVLKRVGQKFGIDEGWMTKVVQDSVHEKDLYAKKDMNIKGVPYTLINQKMVVEGAVDVALYVQMFEDTHYRN